MDNITWFRSTGHFDDHCGDAIGMSTIDIRLYQYVINLLFIINRLQLSFMLGACFDLGMISYPSVTKVQWELNQNWTMHFGYRNSGFFRHRCNVLCLNQIPGSTTYYHMTNSLGYLTVDFDYNDSFVYTTVKWCYWNCYGSKI